jgi:ABC-type glycerol-3-phosphate transport system substrate-binding protein
VNGANQKVMQDGKKKLVEPLPMTVAPGSGADASAGQNSAGGIMVNSSSNPRSAARAFVSWIDESKSGFVIGSCSS